MTQNYDFLKSNVNTYTMGGDQPDIQALLRSSADNSRGTARPNDADKGIPYDGMFWLDSVAREMYIYSTSATAGAGWIRLFEIYDGTMLGGTISGVAQDAWPVGSIYISSKNVNPGLPGILGVGEWTPIALGRALAGIGNNASEGYNIVEGLDGGLRFVTLDPDEIPAHKHPFSIPGVRNWNVLTGSGATVDQQSGTDNLSTGNPSSSGQAFSNLGPYSPVYAWVRGVDPVGPQIGTCIQVDGARTPFNTPMCSGGTISDFDQFWTSRLYWQDTVNIYENSLWSFTPNVSFDILQTFSFWDVTMGQVVHTFPQGLSITAIDGADAICIFNYVQQVDFDYQSLENYTTTPSIRYEKAFFPSASQQRASWWGNEIIVINGVAPP